MGEKRGWWAFGDVKTGYDSGIQNVVSCYYLGRIWLWLAVFCYIRGRDRVPVSTPLPTCFPTEDSSVGEELAKAAFLLMSTLGAVE
jgi:hypothetical protein